MIHKEMTMRKNKANEILNAVIKLLREQQADYGDLASIEDMIDLIERLK